MQRLLLLLLILGVAAGAWWSWRSSSAAESLDPSAERPLAAAPRAGTDLHAAGPENRGPPTPERRTIAASPRAGSEADLVVLVVDTAHRAVPGLPLVLKKDLAAPLSDESRRRSLLLLKKAGARDVGAVTDPAGRAVFRGLRAALRNAPRPLWYVVHDVCFATQPCVPLDAAALAQETVVSIQPAFGAVQIVAREPDGAPATGLGKYSLGLIDPKESSDPTLAWHRKEWSHSSPATADRARFPFVELGRDWAARVYRRAAKLGSTAERAGPVAPGETCRIEVTLGLDHPVAVFRAVDANATPLGSTSLRVAVHRDWGGSSNLSVVTAADGTFHVDCDGDTFFGQHVTVRKEGTATPDQALTGAAQLPRHMTNGRNQLGDIVLRPLTPLVTGTVVDEAGRPLPGIPVRAGRSTHYSSHGFVWFAGVTVEDKTDALGRFALIGALPVEEFKVWADGDGYRSDGRDTRRGARDVRLSCYRIWTPSVDVVVGPDQSWDGVDLRLYPAGAKDGAVGTSEAVQTEGSAHATFAPVRGGRYDLRWSFRGKPLGTRDNLRVDRSGTIARIDLRGVLFRHTIAFSWHRDVPDPGFDLKTSGRIFWRPSGSADKWRVLDFSKAEVVFNSVARAVDLQIYADGCRAEIRNGVTTPQTIRLRPGFRVRLVLRTTGKIPEHPYIFDPAPEVHGHTIGVAVGSRYFTKTKRESVFYLPAGRIDVGWHLERRSKSGAVGGGVLGSHRVPIDVKAQAGEQVFYLDLDGAALDKYMAHVPW